MYSFICPCGQQFSADTKRRKYCDGCRTAKEAPKPGYNPALIVEKRCEYCGNKYQTGRSNAAFCTRACKEKNKRWRQSNPEFTYKQELVRKICGI